MTRQLTRREFSNQSLLAGLGMLAASNLGYAASPNEKLNIGVIGAGGKGESNILGVKRENIIAVSEVDTERGAKGMKMIPKAKHYFDYREMLENEPSLDAVIISTPDHHHAPAAVMAMKMGKHVYCEKPLAHSIYEARVMQKIAKEKKVATQMGNQGHAGPVLREAVEVIRSGAIGKVTQFHAWTNRPSSWPQGIDHLPETAAVPSTLKWDIWLGPAAERDYSPAYLPTKWRGWWDFGTGALGDMACHIVDLGFWALDLAYPTAVEAEAKGVNPFTGPLSSTINYYFPARGENPPVTLTWYDGGRKPDPSLIGATELPGGGSILVGDKGVMFIPSDYGSQYFLLPKEKFVGYQPPAPTLPRNTTFTNEIAVAASHYTEWLNACKGGPPTQSNFDYAALLTEVVLLGNVAIRVGKKIEWDGPNMKAINCPEAEAFIKPKMRDGWVV